MISERCVRLNSKTAGREKEEEKGRGGRERNKDRRKRTHGDKNTKPTQKDRKEAKRIQNSEENYKDKLNYIDHIQ